MHPTNTLRYCFMKCHFDRSHGGSALKALTNTQNKPHSTEVGRSIVREAVMTEKGDNLFIRDYDGDGIFIAKMLFEFVIMLLTRYLSSSGCLICDGYSYSYGHVDFGLF